VIQISQEEIINLLRKTPRLTVKQIAGELNYNIQKVSRAVHKMLNRELISDELTNEELVFLLEQYPKCRFGISRIKVFMVKNE